ncbi:hypothetical protein M436DRAFT_61100 [Aureobasidium namibiae CBS 147.97]|uniref:Uncharacterized protein n=1 Tax=Aureobasidium namibiae CBS 147.97 TaxID=1043004 RepID=A0A074WRK9_9PEZI|nr:uncharacterized protein M436DRAFT_61100 [Aureobasidium namibiae CBS 147.97]KEQ75783.1 hypothetical protein M436DRAFT_61100 [Aureobasidium namibiae CBS 147.97]
MSDHRIMASEIFVLNFTVRDLLLSNHSQAYRLDISLVYPVSIGNIPLLYHGATSFKMEEKMEEQMASILTNFTAGMKEVVVLQTQTRIHLEALEAFEAQARTRPRSPRRPAPVPLSEVNGTSPSTSPEGPRNTLVSTEVITRDAASRSRTKAVAVVACSSGPRLSTSRDQPTEQYFPDQNHTQELSSMLNASTVTVGSHPQSPRSSAGAELGLRNNIGVDVSMPDAGGDSSRSGGKPTFDKGKRTTFNNEGNVGFKTGESSQSNGHLDRVHRSQDGGRRIAGGVRASTARPQQYPVPPTSPTAIPGGPRPQGCQTIEGSTTQETASGQREGHNAQLGNLLDAFVGTWLVRCITTSVFTIICMFNSGQVDKVTSGSRFPWLVQSCDLSKKVGNFEFLRLRVQQEYQIRLPEVRLEIWPARVRHTNFQLRAIWKYCNERCWKLAPYAFNADKRPYEEFKWVVYPTSARSRGDAARNIAEQPDPGLPSAANPVNQTGWPDNLPPPNAPEGPNGGLRKPLPHPSDGSRPVPDGPAAASGSESSANHTLQPVPAPAAHMTVPSGLSRTKGKAPIRFGEASFGPAPRASPPQQPKAVDTRLSGIPLSVSNALCATGTVHPSRTTLIDTTSTRNAVTQTHAPKSGPSQAPKRMPIRLSIPVDSVRPSQSETGRVGQQTPLSGPSICINHSFAKPALDARSSYRGVTKTPGSTESQKQVAPTELGTPSLHSNGKPLPPVGAQSVAVRRSLRAAGKQPVRSEVSITNASSSVPQAKTKSQDQWCERCQTKHFASAANDTLDPVDPVTCNKPHRGICRKLSSARAKDRPSSKATAKQDQAPKRTSKKRKADDADDADEVNVKVGESTSQSMLLSRPKKKRKRESKEKREAKTQAKDKAQTELKGKRKGPVGSKGQWYDPIPVDD